LTTKCFLIWCSQLIFCLHFQTIESRNYDGQSEMKIEPYITEKSAFLFSSSCINWDSTVVTIQASSGSEPISGLRKIDERPDGHTTVLCTTYEPAVSLGQHLIITANLTFRSRPITATWFCKYDNLTCTLVISEGAERLQCSCRVESNTGTSQRYFKGSDIVYHWPTIPTTDSAHFSIICDGYWRISWMFSLTYRGHVFWGYSRLETVFEYTNYLDR